MTQSSERKNGCFNREPFLTQREVQDGWQEVNLSKPSALRPVITIVPYMVTIAHVNSTDCQHDSANDRGCDGCKWQKH